MHVHDVKKLLCRAVRLTKEIRGLTVAGRPSAGPAAGPAAAAAAAARPVAAAVSRSVAARGWPARRHNRSSNSYLY